MSTFLEVFGFMLIVGGVAMVSIPAALIVAGVMLVALGFVLEVD